MSSGKNASTSGEPPTNEQVGIYDRLVPMLEAAHREMSEFSKKKQDGVVNSLKIRNINRLLDKLEGVLDQDPSKEFLERLDEDDLPQNSDAVLLLSQWKAALEQFKKKHFGTDPETHQYRWFTVESPRPERRR